MQPEELYHILHRKPFQPLRVVLKDGRTYNIPFVGMAVVGRTFFDIGIPVPGSSGPYPICEHIERLDLKDVERLEPLVLPPAPATK
jgi:hypothetical protein